MFSKLIHSSQEELHFLPLSLRDIVFNVLPHRDENSTVIYSHLGEEFVSIDLSGLRRATIKIAARLHDMGLRPGDTIMLASFSTSNELANALVFNAATCMGLRVFVPIFPEPAEFSHWKEQTGFTMIIMPFLEILAEKGHEREKEAIYTLQNMCSETNIPFLDANSAFDIPGIIRNSKEDEKDLSATTFPAAVSTKTEAVIFTTSGTSGSSKMVVYTHEGFSNCCQAWQKCGLFAPELFGNPGFSPLFTHTIGIRTFINSIWSGHPFCILVTDWFLHKPEVIRFLLMKMNLGHIIGGPAFFNTMLELFRQFPELKSSMQQSLRAAISIGAPYDQATAEKFRSATGIAMMNGFGTTETLMIALNRHAGTKARSMGMLMPGVTLGLTATDDPEVFEMSIHSAFQSARTIGETAPTDYFDTGDLVKYDESSCEILFHGRKVQDFLKDEYGVKIPFNALRSYYRDLYEQVAWIEWIPMVNIPGLAALIYLPLPSDLNRQKGLAALIKTINEELKRTIEPFEYAHRHLERFSVVADSVPLTRKGTVSTDQIHKKYGQMIEDLRNPFVFNQSIENTETGDKSYIHKFSNPYMAELLETLKLDKVYVKGKGDYLFFRDGDSLRRVLDLVGGFGSGLLGHNHPKIKEAMCQFVEAGYPALNNQGSQYYYPGLLARELNRIFSKKTGRYFKVQFASSGTEAVEKALHHAYYEWRLRIEKIRDEQLQLFGADPGLQIAELWERNMQIIDAATPAVLVVNNCFHGNTSAARSLLNHKKQRDFFIGLLNINPLHLSDTLPGWKDQAVSFISGSSVCLNLVKSNNGAYNTVPVNFSTVIAALIEPVRGEGGIYEMNPEMADFLATQEFPLISDEIQCGMGRTGNFPAYRKASYYLLGKSLGGGTQKIAALLIDDRRFKPLLAKYFNSTFDNGELAAFVALATVGIIEEENLSGIALEKGKKYLVLLQEVAAKYPGIIESVNGAGLMIGIHFNPRLGDHNTLLRILTENEMLGYLLAGWLLNVHNIRMLPSLSKPNSLRIEPSCYIDDDEINKFCIILEEMCGLLRDKKMYELLRFLMNGDPYPDKMFPVFEGLFPQEIDTPAEGAVKAGFIGNFTLSHRELQVIEPDLVQASDTGLRILFNRLSTLLDGKPIRIMSKNLLNGKVHFAFYILPFDTAQMEVVSRWGKKRFYISKIQEAVDKLTAEGTACISLGAHTSIITGNCLTLAERNGCRILTGNSLTVASCLWHLDNYIADIPKAGPGPHTIAIVGAGGNIGTGLTACLEDGKYSRHTLILAGNNEKRLLRLKEGFRNRESQVICTADLFEVRNANIIICCANTNDPIIFPHHINSEKPVFIIDLSVPRAVSADVSRLRNVTFCHLASSVYIEGTSGMLVSSHTPVSRLFCCAGESILTALHGLQMPMKGHISRSSVEALVPLAFKEGFFKTTGDGVSV